MAAKKKQNGEWWDSENNDFDNDIEQFSRNDGLPGGGGCMLTILVTLSAALLSIVVFVAL